MQELDKYEKELDPPTMMEFELFLRLGNLFDILIGNQNWTDLLIDEELLEAADLLEKAGEKYDNMLMDWYRGQNEIPT
jgi:hypothetical protein